MAAKKKLIDKTPTIMVILLCGLMFVSNIISSALQVLFRRKNWRDFLRETGQIRVIEMPDMIE
ncbi:MAG TPA: hypothetical protein VJZ75_10740 [Candidatus Bathyarchaeia archaeon]|nr:hypothetical protein [Candidatus Bathyarchaeia archaeon]